jgi:hypothetical protein
MAFENCSKWLVPVNLPVRIATKLIGQESWEYATVSHANGQPKETIAFSLNFLPTEVDYFLLLQLIMQVPEPGAYNPASEAAEAT